jgi:group I intron endonuclease
MRSGIYKITNTTNKKFYIGSAKDIDHRWYCHTNDLNANRHVNPKFQNAWHKYGESSFTFEIIESVEPKPELLLEREDHYLQLLKPYEQSVGYNIGANASGGDNFTYNPRKEEIRANLSRLSLGENNGMFGKKHNEDSIKQQKNKSVGRYTLEWFVQRHGTIEGEKKFEERRQMLMNRKINYVTVTTPIMSFKGHKHGDDFKDKYNRSKNYFKNNWNEFVELVKSGKYSQRQLSEMLGISRPTLKVKMKEALGQKEGGDFSPPIFVINY